MMAWLLNLELQQLTSEAAWSPLESALMLLTVDSASALLHSVVTMEIS